MRKTFRKWDKPSRRSRRAIRGNKENWWTSNRISRNWIHLSCFLAQRWTARSSSISAGKAPWSRSARKGHQKFCWMILWPVLPKTQELRRGKDKIRLSFKTLNPNNQIKKHDVSATKINQLLFNYPRIL